MLTINEIVSLCEEYRKVSGRKPLWTNVYAFIHVCQRHGPYVQQDVVDEWCKRRDAEANNSFYNRVQDARRILDYANERGYTDVAVHVQVKWSKPASKLIRLKEEELKNFFRAIDQYPFYTAVFPNEINELTCKAIFKLMYSNGLRPVEVRELEREDVDLVYGVIKIRRTKGYRQHQIVVNDDMLMLLKRYDEQINRLVQHRSSFFLNGSGKKLGRDYIDTWFSRFWYKYNTTPAVAYHLRHNYAIANFNAMSGMNIDQAYKYIVALSNSMGHASIKQTLYYYSLTAQYSEVLNRLSSENINNIIHQLPHEENRF